MTSQRKAILEKLEPSQQSLRLFSWEHDLSAITVHTAEAKQRFYEGFGNNWHYHPEYELNLMLEGEGLLFVGDYIGQFQAPDAILLGANLPHYWKARGRVKGIAIQFLETNFSTIAEFSQLKPLLEASQYGLRLTDKSLEASINSLETMLNRTSLKRLAEFLTLFAGFSTRIGENSSLSQQAISLASGKDEAMSLVIDYVLQNFHAPLSFDKAVQISGLSRSSFHRQFKKMTGSSFSHYVNNVRLQEAKRLVVVSQQAITSIAFDTGFRNLSHFNALFKKQFGYSPRQLRKKVD